MSEDYKPGDIKQVICRRAMTDALREMRRLGGVKMLHAFLDECVTMGMDIDEPTLNQAENIIPEAKRRVMKGEATRVHIDISVSPGTGEQEHKPPKSKRDKTTKSANERMMKAVDDDARRKQWQSEQWAGYLGLPDASYVRKLPFWKTLRSFDSGG